MQDVKIIVNELCMSFERQLSLYKELLDGVRANMSQLILSRGDPGILMVGVDKKVKLIDKINQERSDVAGHIEFWQEHREKLSNTVDAAALNDILTRTEDIIKEFLAEEEKLKQYVEKMYSKSATFN